MWGTTAPAVKIDKLRWGRRLLRAPEQLSQTPVPGPTRRPAGVLTPRGGGESGESQASPDPRPGPPQPDDAGSHASEGAASRSLEDRGSLNLR